MCNLVHEEYKPIEKSGYAWKLFSKNLHGNLVQLFSMDLYEKDIYEKDDYSSWISWSKHSFNGDGFCAFASKEEAERALQDLQRGITDREYSDATLREIQYEGGLALQKEPRMVCGKVYETIIIKRFRIIEQGEENG